MILPFEQETPIEMAGCKGHHLSRMWRAGLPVPDGFSITWDGLAKTCSSELDRALADLRASAFAVRSSAIQEDAAGASFAGILASRLNITLAGVESALQDIQRSAAAVTARWYSMRLNMPSSLKIAAVVQTFLPAQASGVLFMRDPRSAAGHFVVEACWGLGPGVADGLVRPDRWIISADGSVISFEIADKDIAVLASVHGGTSHIAVDPACRRRPCLSPELLQQLARLAVQCERLFGTPQDIEWAIHDGRAWLLQSRPITRSGA